MRRLLLDTHALLWWREVNSRRPPNIHHLARWMFVQAIHGLPYQGVFQHPVSLFHGTSAGLLVWEHRDPFDRMLVAQAQAEGLEVVTADARLLGFGIRTVDASK
ncbi:MAG: PIN domain nuclease [Halothiobacillus sp.]|nr:PIN domain nuclease [Halothiobacillus sp.]